MDTPGDWHEHTPKLIYLARRNPHLSREAFTPRWRQHGALGMSMPRWVTVRLYGHSDVICPPATIPGISTDADGVGMIWYRDADARARNRADTTSQATMEADERETFDRLVAKCAVVTKEVVLRRGPRPPFKLMSFIKKAPGIDKDRLERITKDDYAPAMLGQTFGTAGGIVRYVLNYADRSDPQVSSGLDYDLVEELWFQNAADQLTAAAAFPAFATRQSAPFASDRVTYLTNEVILHDKL